MKLPVFRDPVTNQPSVSVTLVAVTFTVVIAKWMIGGLTIAGHPFAEVSNEAVTTWLSPVFLLYFGRAATKATEAVQMARTTGAKAPTEAL